jgi:hypothetical protein
MQADMGHSNGPRGIPNGQLEVDVTGSQVVPITHVTHHHPQTNLEHRQVSSSSSKHGSSTCSSSSNHNHHQQ